MRDLCSQYGRQGIDEADACYSMLLAFNQVCSSQFGHFSKVLRIDVLCNCFINVQAHAASMIMKEHIMFLQDQSLEVENSELRAELERVQSDLAYVRESHLHMGSEARPLGRGTLAETDAVAAKEAAEQMRQMAENAETVAFIFEVMMMMI